MTREHKDRSAFGREIHLGPANDSNPQHADEIHAADWVARCDSYQEPRYPYGDDDGWISLDFDGDGWPWDPTRPLAGQYEEWEASQRRAIAGETAARHGERDDE